MQINFKSAAHVRRSITSLTRMPWNGSNPSFPVPNLAIDGQLHVARELHRLFIAGGVQILERDLAASVYVKEPIKLHGASMLSSQRESSNPASILKDCSIPAIGLERANGLLKFGANVRRQA